MHAMPLKTNAWKVTKGLEGEQHLMELLGGVESDFKVVCGHFVVTFLKWGEVRALPASGFPAQVCTGEWLSSHLRWLPLCSLCLDVSQAFLLIVRKELPFEYDSDHPTHWTLGCEVVAGGSHCVGLVL